MVHAHVHNYQSPKRLTRSNNVQNLTEESRDLLFDTVAPRVKTLCSFIHDNTVRTAEGSAGSCLTMQYTPHSHVTINPQLCLRTVSGKTGGAWGRLRDSESDWKRHGGVWEILKKRTCKCRHKAKEDRQTENGWETVNLWERSANWFWFGKKKPQKGSAFQRQFNTRSTFLRGRH